MKRVLVITAAIVGLAACGDQPKPAYQPTNDQLREWASQDRAKAASEAEAEARRDAEWAERDRAAAAARAGHSGGSNTSMDAAPAPGVPQVQLDGSASGTVEPPTAQPTPMGQHQP